MLILLRVLLLWLMAASAAIAVELQPDGPAQLDARGFQYFIEQSPLSRDDIVRQDATLPWIAVDKPALNLHQETRPVWVKIPLHNGVAETVNWMLMIPWTMLAQVEVNVLRGDGRWDAVQRSGYDVARSELALDYRLPVFHLPLAGQEQVTLYLRARTDIVLFLPTLMLTPEGFTQYKDTSNLIYGVGLGILLAMMLYNLSLYIFVRSVSYLAYAFYVLSIIVYQLANTGLGADLLWGDTVLDNGYSFMLFAETSFFAAVLFGRYFLNLKRRGGWLLRLNSGLLFYWGGMLLLNMAGVHIVARYTFNLMSLLTCVIGLWTAIALWRRGDKSARLFTIAWSFPIVATFVAVLMMVGLIEFNVFTENVQLASFTVELLLLSFALAERINRERLQRDVAQKSALHALEQLDLERSAKLAAQEQALHLQKRHSDELELRVLDRTAELERAMKNLELANRELAKLSVTDPLTRLHNRRYFDETLQAELSRATRTRQPLSLILVDIDHFKSINDTYGHLVGDECLKLVAATLRQVVTRTTDLVARYGGEEFAVVLPAAVEKEACEMANRIRVAIEKLQFIHAGKRIAISASLGVAGRMPTQFDTPNRFITAADEALYQAKEAGRNRVIAAQLADAG